MVRSTKQKNHEFSILECSRLDYFHDFKSNDDKVKCGGWTTIESLGKVLLAPFTDECDANTLTFEPNRTLYPPTYPFETAVTPHDTRTREHQMSLRTATATKKLTELSLTLFLDTR
ncbi:hypothetical protein ACTXT7_011741, partial [Hymenolepis weldensis]